MRFKRSLASGVLAAIAATLVIPTLSAGASVSSSASKPTIIIGSTNFEEQAIVSNIWADVLEKAGYQVTVEPSLGTRDIVVPAIEKGQIDLEPDYAASLLGYLENGKILPAAGLISTAVPADQKALASFGVTVLARHQGARHERVRRDQGHGQQGPPHDRFEPEAVCLESHAGRTARVPDLRAL